MSDKWLTSLITADAESGYELAINLSNKLVVSEKFEEFLTLPAYQFI